MNQPYQSPGNASLNYLPPSKQPTANKQATQEAQKAVFDTLQTDGWSMQWKTSTLSADKIKAWIHIPNSYSATSWEKPSYNTTIVFDPKEYAALFSEAKQEASRYLQALPNCTQEQYIAVHLQAIQKAIITHTWATQQQAEINMKKITTDALAQWETAIDWKVVSHYNAEVCNSKSTVAAYYLAEHCPTIDRKLDSTQEYEWWKDWHQDIIFSFWWKKYAFHPNSPVDGKPNIATL
jgi:hypothetical protein